MRLLLQAAPILLGRGCGDELQQVEGDLVETTWPRRRRDRREPPPNGDNPHWRTDRLYRHPPCSHVPVFSSFLGRRRAVV